MTFFTVPEATNASQQPQQRNATQPREGAQTTQRTNVTPRSSPGVHSDNDTALIPERQRRRPVLDLNPAGRVSMVVRV